MSFYLCDSGIATKKREQPELEVEETFSGVKIAEEEETFCGFKIAKDSCFKHFGGTSVPSHFPARGWSSAEEIWADVKRDFKRDFKRRMSSRDFTTNQTEITVLVDPVFNYSHDTRNLNAVPVKVQLNKLVGDGREVPNGRARLFNSLGIPIWEGELEDGEPALDGASITHRTVDIHTGPCCSRSLQSITVLHSNLQMWWCLPISA